MEEYTRQMEEYRQKMDECEKRNAELHEIQRKLREYGEKEIEFASRTDALCETTLPKLCDCSKCPAMELCKWLEDNEQEKNRLYAELIKQTT